MPDKNARRVSKALRDFALESAKGLLGGGMRIPSAPALLRTSKKPAPKVSTTKNFQVKRTGKNVAGDIYPVK
jgi:hypothetical protein